MDPATVATVVELAPEVIELIQQIIENQGDDLNAENFNAIADALYTDIEGENGELIHVSVADIASLQLQQTMISYKSANKVLIKKQPFASSDKNKTLQTKI